MKQYDINNDNPELIEAKKKHFPHLLSIKEILSLDKNFWIRRYTELNWGKSVLSQAQWIISLTVLLKVFDAPTWTYAASPVCIIIGTWFTGYLFNKHIRVGYQNEMFKQTVVQK